MSTALSATSFCAEDDKMILEDEGARMALAGPGLPVQQLVTGRLGYIAVAAEQGQVS